MKATEVVASQAYRSKRDHLTAGSGKFPGSPPGGDTINLLRNRSSSDTAFGSGLRCSCLVPTKFRRKNDHYFNY